MSCLPCRSQCPAPPTSVSIHTPPPTPAFHQASLYTIWFIATWNDLLPVPSLPSFSFSPSFLACSLPASPFSTSLPQGWGLHFGHCHILRAWIRAWPTVETLSICRIMDGIFSALGCTMALGAVHGQKKGDDTCIQVPRHCPGPQKWYLLPSKKDVCTWKSLGMLGRC